MPWHGLSNARQLCQRTALQLCWKLCLSRVHNSMTSAPTEAQQTGLRPPDFVKPRFYGDLKFVEKVLQNHRNLRSHENLFLSDLDLSKINIISKFEVNPLGRLIRTVHTLGRLIGPFDQNRPYIGPIDQNRPYIGPFDQNRPYIGPIDQNRPYIGPFDQNRPYIGPFDQNRPYIGPFDQNRPYIGPFDQNRPYIGPFDQNRPYIGPFDQNRPYIEILIEILNKDRILVKSI
jgi:hypothetical protein